MNSFDDFFKKHPHTLLDVSYESTGMLEVENTSCEHCHKILGGGRVYHSNNYLVNDFWNNITENDKYNEFLKTSSKNTHVFAFLNKDYIKNIINCYNSLKSAGFKNVYFHLITDSESNLFINKFCQYINNKDYEVVLSISGESYLDDEDDNKILDYYRVLTDGNSIFKNIRDFLNESTIVNYEEIKPHLFNKDINIEMDDNVLWLEQNVHNIKVLKAFADLGANVYTYFKVDNKVNYFIEEENMDNSLGIYLSKLDVKQARVTEKIKEHELIDAFDGTNKKIPNCDRFIIDSVNEDSPQMNIVDITKRAVDLMEKDYPLIIVNFPNCDIYGIKADKEMAVQACMSVDVCLGQIIEQAENNFYTVVLVSDHGRIENLKHPEKNSYQVPLVISDDKVSFEDGGTIANFAPTLLDYMEIKIPDEMDRASLLKND